MFVNHAFHRAVLLLALVCLNTISSMAAPEGPYVYLTKQLATTQESFVKVVNNRSWQGTPISVGGKKFERGIGVHADSKLVFPLEGKFTSFHVVPGPDDAHNGSIEMKILVDDKEVFTTGVTRSSDETPREPLDIPLEGAQTLTLMVLQANGSKAGDHASWANAYLVRPWDKPVPEPRPIASTHLPKDKLQPFLDQHCISCHGPDKQKAKLRFDTAKWEITNNDEAQRWQDVLDVLNAGEMPPEDEPQPTPDDLSSTLDTLTGSLLDARRRLTDQGGEIKMRKLNRREYANTISDLFGLRLWPFDIPEDSETELFDTLGESQFFTSKDLDEYLELGHKIATEAFHWHAQPRLERRTGRYDLGKSTFGGRKRSVEKNEAIRKKLSEGVHWKELGFSDNGQKEIFVRQYWMNTLLSKKYITFPKAETGRYLIGDDYVRFSPSHDPRARFLFRIHGGIAAEHATEARKHLVVRDVHRNYEGSLKVLGTPDQPQTVEISLPPVYLGDQRSLIVLREFDPSSSNHYLREEVLKSDDPNKLERPWAPIWLDWMEADGPIYPDKRSHFETILLPSGFTPPAEGPLFADADAENFIAKFAFEAFRRSPPSEPYLTGLNQLYHSHRKEGLSEHEAMSEVVSVILTSPNFLYIRRQQESEESTPLLSSRELAVRLSYFLWSRPPDDELYAADLSKVGQIARQIDRMLDDPRSKAFRDGFASQWAEMDRYDAITVDPEEVPLFKDSLRSSARKEAAAFFGTLIDENLPARNLIDSDFVTIDPLLAMHYGLDETTLKTGEYTKVKLPADSPRGGLMTQAAFLTLGSNGERSSPVIRGALVMEKLLRDKPAPPPPNVPELGSDDGIPRTNREMVKLHQEQAVCASCHKKMDVIGFGLENFDTVGRWRDTEPVGDQQVPIDPAGTLPGGAAFTTVQELKDTLLAQEDALARELMESMFSYGLGRTIEFSDANEIERLLALIKDKDYPVRSMIHEVALSPLFRKR